MSVAAICAAAQLIFLFGHTRLAVKLACVLGRWAVFRIYMQLLMHHWSGIPGLPGSICVDTTVTDGHRQGGKSLKLINTSSHSPNDGQASPCLNFHSTHIPILIACSILCLVLSHHCPIQYTCTTIHRFLISPSVPASLGTCFTLSFSIHS